MPTQRKPRVLAVAATAAVLAVGGVAAVRFGPWNQEFWLGRSSLLALDQRTRENPKDGAAWYYLGMRLREKGDPDQALEAFQQAHSVRPTDARILAGYGQALLDANRVEEAFQLLKSAGEAGGAPEPRMVLARLYQRRGAYHRAVAEWHEVLRLDPKRADAWYFLAFCHLQMQQVSQAIEAVDRAIGLEASNSRFHRLRGSILAAKGDLSGARDAFEKAIAQAPEDARSHHDLANFLLTQSQASEDVQRAEVATRELSRLAPDYPLISWLRARIAVSRKQWGPAVRDLEETIRVEPALDEAHFHLANAYHRLGRHAEGDRAMVEYRRRGELTRRMDEVRIRIAMAEDPELRFELAALQRQAGLLSQARESVRQGLQSAPDAARGKAELAAIERAERERATGARTSGAQPAEGGMR